MQPASATPRIDYTESYRAMLHRMAEIGMAAAERINAQMAAQPTEPPTQPASADPAPPAEPIRPARPAHPAEPAGKPAASPTIELDRIARMIRRNAHLSDSLGRPARRTNNEGMPIDVCRRLLIRDIEEAIQECADPEDVESLRDDLNERLDRPELDEDIEYRVLAQVMSEIRKDMGFENKPGRPPWVRRTAAEWADLCRRSASRPTPPAQPGTVHHLDPTRFRGKPHPAP